MKEIPLKEWSCRLLEDQLVRLDELRNATPRDAGFKLWRQTTLTVIQRVWPGNLQRSERFRRIPFTAPTAKPNRAQVREHFERGCAEANSLLRGLILEIETGALEPARAASNEPAAGTPTLKPTSPRGPSPESRAIAAWLAAPLPGEVSPAGGASAREEAHEDPASPAPAKQAIPARASKAPRRSEKRALKEMLGFADNFAVARPEPASPPDESYAPPRPAPSFGEHGRDDVSPFASPPQAAASTPERVAELEPVAELDPAFAPEPVVELELVAAPEPATDEAPEMDVDFERVSWTPGRVAAPPLPAAPAPAVEIAHTAAFAPVAAAEPAALALAPVRHVPGPEPRTAAAATLVALAGEVASLGVPEGQRAATRAALFGLSRQIDERSASWETLRDALRMVMDYPPLARRVVPLLVPYLDLE